MACHECYILDKMLFFFLLFQGLIYFQNECYIYYLSYSACKYHPVKIVKAWLFFLLVFHLHLLSVNNAKVHRCRNYCLWKFIYMTSWLILLTWLSLGYLETKLKAFYECCRKKFSISNTWWKSALCFLCSQVGWLICNVYWAQ